MGWTEIAMDAFAGRLCGRPQRDVRDRRRAHDRAGADRDVRPRPQDRGRARRSSLCCCRRDCWECSNTGGGAS